MVLVDVTWSEWRPSRDWPRYEQIVKTLLQPPAPAAGDLGPVYVHQCYEEDRGDTSWVLPSGPYELPPSDVCQKPDDWLVGTEGLGRVLAELDLEEATARGSSTATLDEVPDWRKLFRTRIFMRADRFRAVAGCEGSIDYWILIDMRFQWIAQGSVLWHTSFTVWSDLPWSVHHRSAYPAVRELRELSARDAVALIADYEVSRTAFRDKASTWLAVAFGVLGLSGVAQATLPLPAINGVLVWGVQIFLWLVTSAVVAASVYQFRKLRGAGRVASHAFERRYRVVREFLANVSTDRLEAFQRAQQVSGGNPAPQQSWRKLDEQLSAEFIAAWAIADEAEAAERADYEAAALRTRVESWTLRTLMLTERPRDFGRYSLPYLTCLYRISTAQELKDWRAPEEMANADSAVGLEELRRVLTGAQYEWFTRQEAGLLRRTSAAIFETLKASWPGHVPVPDPAGDQAARVHGADAPSVPAPSAPAPGG